MEILMEKWVKVYFDERYEISSFGRVRSYIKTNGRGLVKDPRYLKPIINSKGYNMVNVGRKLQKLSRLVMKCFCGESELTVNHKNGIKTDDRLENLEYCTISENILHAYRTGLKACGEKHHKSKITKNQALEIFYDKRTQREIAKSYGISQPSVKCIKKKQSWKCLW
jgi:hypothetical protein